MQSVGRWALTVKLTNMVVRGLSKTYSATAMSKGGLNWLRGTVIRKSGLSGSSHASTRPSTPQVVSTSTIVFGGGVKDATGKTAEYSVRVICVFSISFVDLLSS